MEPNQSKPNIDPISVKTTGEDIIEETELKSEPTPEIYREDDSFLKSLYEAMGDEGAEGKEPTENMDGEG